MFFQFHKKLKPQIIFLRLLKKTPMKLTTHETTGYLVCSLVIQ